MIKYIIEKEDEHKFLEFEKTIKRIMIDQHENLLSYQIDTEIVWKNQTKTG
jgi:hypothetical protein